MYQHIHKKKDYHQLDLKVIALTVSNLIKNNLAYNVLSIQKEIKLHYKFKISYYKAWFKKQIIEELFWYI